MQEIEQLVLSPTFWVGTVVVGILVGVLANAIYGRLIPWLLRANERSRVHASVKRLLIRATFAADLQRLRDDPALVTTELVRDRRDRDSIFSRILLLAVIPYAFLSEALPVNWWSLLCLGPISFLVLFELLYCIKRNVDRKILLEAYVGEPDRSKGG